MKRETAWLIAGIILLVPAVIYAISWYLIPGWKGIPGGPWILLGLVLVGGFSVLNYIFGILEKLGLVGKKETAKTEIKINGGSPRIDTGDHTTNVKGTNIEKQEIEAPRNLVIGTQYQTIYAGVNPRQVEEEELQAGLTRLAKLPEDEVPEPGCTAEGFSFSKYSSQSVIRWA